MEVVHPFSPHLIPIIPVTSWSGQRSISLDCSNRVARGEHSGGGYLSEEEERDREEADEKLRKKLEKRERRKTHDGWESGAHAVTYGNNPFQASHEQSKQRHHHHYHPHSHQQQHYHQSQYGYHYRGVSNGTGDNF